jgi:hypothetical protein
MDDLLCFALFAFLQYSSQFVNLSLEPSNLQVFSFKQLVVGNLLIS